MSWVHWPRFGDTRKSKPPTHTVHMHWVCTGTHNVGVVLVMLVVLVVVGRFQPCKNFLVRAHTHTSLSGDQQEDWLTGWQSYSSHPCLMRSFTPVRDGAHSCKSYSRIVFSSSLGSGVKCAQTAPAYSTHKQVSIFLYICMYTVYVVFSNFPWTDENDSSPV